MSKDSENPASAATGKGDKFFERAEQVAETGNWDFAIDLYLQGLRRDPDNVERGHQPLREVALKRTAMGGKPPGMIEKLKTRPGKDPLDNLIKGAGLLAKEPGGIEQMMMTLKAARQLELAETSPWIARICLEAQRSAAKPSKRILIEIANAFADMEMYPHALEACDLAKALDPDDAELSQMISRLSTKYTIQKGRYGEEGDFTKAVKDMDHQKQLAQEDAMVQDESVLTARMEKARQEYVASPTTPGKINAYVDALLRFEDDAHEAQAVEVLRKAHEASGAYQFKMRIDDVRIRQRRRKIHQLREEGKDQEVLRQRRALLALELDVYNERAVNYPTDLGIKFELGRRQYQGGKFDDAIGSLQQAANDPRRRLQAMNYLGLAFAKKGWLREAAETFDRALQGDVPELRTKELLYNLGDVLEKMDKFSEAQDAFSRLAQIDYQYKDCRDRLDNIRKQTEAKADEGG